MTKACMAVTKAGTPQIQLGHRLELASLWIFWIFMVIQRGCSTIIDLAKTAKGSVQNERANQKHLWRLHPYTVKIQLGKYAKYPAGQAAVPQDRLQAGVLCGQCKSSYGSHGHMRRARMIAGTHIDRYCRRCGCHLGKQQRRSCQRSGDADA